MEEKIINYIYENFPKKTALLLGFFLLLIIFALFNNFIEQIIPNIKYRFIGYILISIGWFIYWIYKKNILPKNKKNYVGIIICINTENNKQEIRIKNDFTKKLNKLISENNLGNIVNVLLLNNYQTNYVSNVLNQYAKNKKGEKENKNWNKIRKSIKGHFYIYGDIKERKDGENKYFFNLEALVVHAPVDLLVQEQIIQDFLSVWYKQISFTEKIEFKGFKFTADLIFVAVKYVVGIAALVSGDVFIALKLHNSLSNDQYFQKFNPLPPNLKYVKRKLKTLLAEENLLAAKIYSYQNKFDISKKYLDISFAVQPSYEAFLLKAIIEFSSENDPKKALKTIYEAKKYAKNNGTWRYSEAFLLMNLEQFEKALKVYRKIAKNSFDGEESVLNEVYTFNKKLISSNPKHIQSYFILGFLNYKKENNYPEAYSNFEKFLQAENVNNIKYTGLVQKAKSYKMELEDKMKIKEKE